MAHSRPHSEFSSTRRYAFLEGSTRYFNSPNWQNRHTVGVSLQVAFFVRCFAVYKEGRQAQGWQVACPGTGRLRGNWQQQGQQGYKGCQAWASMPGSQSTGCHQQPARLPFISQARIVTAPPGTPVHKVKVSEGHLQCCLFCLPAIPSLLLALYLQHQMYSPGQQQAQSRHMFKVEVLRREGLRSTYSTQGHTAPREPG